jgi:hypothetical protein
VATDFGKLIAVAHLISKFSLRIKLDVYFTTKLPPHPPDCRKQVGRCSVPAYEKVHVALCPLLAASDRPVDGTPVYFVSEPC